jgi:hypothetical protein
MFFGEAVVSDDALAEMANGLKEHELDIDWALGTILRSRLFFSTANLRMRVLGPVEFVVGALHALALCQPPPSTLLLADWAARMGQDLFNPPNVGGWLEGRTWLTSRGVLARANFAAALVEKRLWTAAGGLAVSIGVPREHHAGDLKTAVRFFADLLWGDVHPAVVEDCLAAIKDIDDAESRLSAAVYWLLTRPESQLG